MGGGGGGTLILFDTCVGSGVVVFLNLIITLFLGGFRNINIFGCMKVLWIFFFFFFFLGGGGVGSRQNWTSFRCLFYVF